MLVHNIDKLERLKTNHPVLNVHKAKVLDFDWHPFMDTLLATASEDTSVKVSVIPDEGLTTNLNECAVTLKGHQKKAHLLHFHPGANNVLASAAYDHDIKVWDIEAQAEMYGFTDHSELIQSFEWNSNGSMIGTTCKDKKIRTYDPRQQGAVVCVDGHPGGKSSRCVWMDDKNKFCVVGFSKTSMRKIGLWDPRKMSTCMHEVDIDQSAGVIMPYYDPDTSMLYLGGKGDGTIRYYEMVDEEPYIHFLDNYRSNEAQKGLTFLPKRACDTGLCEVAKALRLCRNWVEPVSFRVPRKSDNFQADIFPDAYAGIPAMTAQDWAGGKNTEPPKASMAPGQGSSGSKMTFKAKKSSAELQKELDAANKRIKELEAEVARLKA